MIDVNVMMCFLLSFVYGNNRIMIRSDEWNGVKRSEMKSDLQWPECQNIKGGHTLHCIRLSVQVKVFPLFLLMLTVSEDWRPNTQMCEFISRGNNG